MAPRVDLTVLAGKREYRPKIDLTQPSVSEFATSCCFLINHGPFAEWIASKEICNCATAKPHSKRVDPATGVPVTSGGVLRRFTTEDLYCTTIAHFNKYLLTRGAVDLVKEQQLNQELICLLSNSGIDCSHILQKYPDRPPLENLRFESPPGGQWETMGILIVRNNAVFAAEGAGNIV
jgi:hypothetical protein